MSWLMASLRMIVWRLRFYYFRYYRRVDLDRTVRVGRSVIFDRTYPQGIHIGRHTYITNNVTILTHDHTRRLRRQNTHIGERCFIGNNAIILPGLRIGSEVIIGAGSVVTRDIQSNCVVAGNPAIIRRTGIRVDEGARMIDGGQAEKKPQ